MERVVIGEVVDTDGTGADFETEGVITATPDLYIPLEPSVKAFKLTGIRYYLNMTNGETFEIVLFRKAVADDLETLAAIVWRSGAAKADSTQYFVRNNEDDLPIDIELEDAGKLYYMILWTGAPGNTPGYLCIEGVEMLAARQ